MATHHRSLGKLYSRVPNGCDCGKGARVLVGKSGVRCMKMVKVGNRSRWLISKTPPKCNGIKPKAKKRAKR